MPRLEGCYNVNPVEGTLLERRQMPYEIEGATVVEQAAWMLEASEGLEAASLDSEHDCDDMGSTTYYVMGRRPMTDAEKGEWNRQADLERRQRAHMERTPRW